MQITFLIGNGFDKCLGLPTSYQEFYKYYIQQESSSTEIKHIKEILKKASEEDGTSSPQIKLWKDLEMALGQITQEYEDPDKFEEIYLDINESLRTYIEQCSNNFEADSKIKEILIKDLVAPYNHLPEAQIGTVKSYLRFGEDWYINIISFNYTNSIEKIFGLTQLSLTELSNRVGGTVFLNKLSHIHGTCDASILLGVNDTSQINNESFKTNEDICDFLVKPIIQTAMKTLIESQCKQNIIDSKLIIIFGMSLGPSDNQWWEIIIQQCLLGSTNVIIFLYDTKISKLNQHEAFLLARHEREFLKNLIKQLNLNLDEKEMEILRRRIFIRYQDKGIFNFNE